MVRTYRRRSWLDPRLEVRPSPIAGRGLFARKPIQAGEVVVLWGGVLMTAEDIHAGRARAGSIAAVEEGVYLAGPAEAEASPDDFMNHSCDPNVWMRDEVTLVARRDILAGEELTADYAMWEADESWAAPWHCRCGSAGCRGRVTGHDWRLPDLQARYRGHFSPFIERRIVAA